MQTEELVNRLVALRPLITNVIGFHDLSEHDTPPITPLDRAIYDAQVYANGVELAKQVYGIMLELQDIEPGDGS